MRRRLARLAAALAASEAVQARLEEAACERVLGRARYGEPGRLHRHGARLFSQHEEDGIIAEIFRRIGSGGRRFVELGAGDGLENNTHALLFAGWHGHWFEGSSGRAAAIRAGLPRTMASGRLKLVEGVLEPEGLARHLAAHGVPQRPDLLSIDVDGNDLHLLEALGPVRPRVIVAEYNARFPPPMGYCRAYAKGHVWDGTGDYGASLATLAERLGARGYRLVGCNLTGVNAFFVAAEEAEPAGRFRTPFTAEEHYEPRRPWRHAFPSGHTVSYGILENSELIRGAEQ